MKRPVLVGIIAVAFSFGALAGVALAKKKGPTLDPGVYVGQTADAAADALLALAEDLAGQGSYENIHLARVCYLSGRKDKARAILDRVLSNSKVTPGDWIRVGRIYQQAGEWNEAREVFDRVLSLAPEDEDWLAEIGAYYNLAGDRERAEELFNRSFSKGTGLKNVLAIAGSYVDVAPRGN